MLQPFLQRGLQKVSRGLSDGKGEQSSHCVAAPHHLHHQLSQPSGRGTVYICASAFDTLPLPPTVRLILTEVQQVTIQSGTLGCLNADASHKVQLEVVMACELLREPDKLLNSQQLHSSCIPCSNLFPINACQDYSAALVLKGSAAGH